MHRKHLALFASSVLIAACGGGDDDPDQGGGTTYTVSATVSGLPTGTTLVLSNNGTDTLPVTANGSLAFSTRIASGGAYAVAVTTQPTGATCAVASGSGTVASANVNVAVTCTLNSYSVGGTVTGLLTGNSVVLQNNAANNTTVSANGAFSFSSSVLSGSAYAVTVLTQPPGQTCAVTNGSGTVAGSNISNVAVNCTANSYDVAVTVLGPPSVAGLVVQNNGGDNIAVPTGGSYTFQTKVASGSPYAVTIQSQPGGQTCRVVAGSGTVHDANVKVAVACPWHIAYVAERGNGPAQTAPGTVSAYYMDATTGALSPLAGSPFAAGIGPTDLKIDPTGKFVYVTNFYSGTISAYAIDPSSGALSAVAGSPFASGTNQGGMAIDPNGEFAYVAAAANVLYGYSINPTTGALTGIAGSPFTTLNGGFNTRANVVTTDPSGGFAYLGLGGAGLGTSSRVATGSIDPSTGVVTPASTIINGPNTAVTGVAVDSNGSFVYVTDHQSPGTAGFVRGYTRDGVTGALTVMAGSPFASPFHPSSFLIGPDGRFAYVPASDDIWVYGIDGTTGELAQITGSPFAAPGDPGVPAGATTIAIDPSGSLAAVVRLQKISVFRINGTNGALTEVSGSPFATTTYPVSIAIK